MKKIVLIIATLTIHSLNAQNPTIDLSKNLALLEINLMVLDNLIPKPEKKAITDQLRMENIKTLFTKYIITPNNEFLEELNELFIGLNEEEYAQMLTNYNSFINTYRDQSDKITEPDLQTVAAFTTWYTNQIKIIKVEPAMKELEKIYLDNNFKKIASITTKSVLNIRLTTLDTFDKILEEQKDSIALYTKWSPQIQDANYEAFKAWSNEKRKELINQLEKAKGPAFTPLQQGTLTKKTYCKFPTDTQLLMKNNKTLIIGKSDLSPYLDEKENLLNVSQVIAFQEGVNGKLVDIINPKTLKPTSKTFILPSGSIDLEITWVNKLPEKSGWCAS